MYRRSVKARRYGVGARRRNYVRRTASRRYSRFAKRRGVSVVLLRRASRSRVRRLIGRKRMVGRKRRVARTGTLSKPTLVRVTNGVFSRRSEWSSLTPVGKANVIITDVVTRAKGILTEMDAMVKSSNLAAEPSALPSAIPLKLGEAVYPFLSKKYKLLRRLVARIVSAQKAVNIATAADTALKQAMPPGFQFLVAPLTETQQKVYASGWKAGAINGPVQTVAVALDPAIAAAAAVPPVA